MSVQWLSRPERGSLWLTKFIVYLSLNTDRLVGRLLLHPIVIYFCLFSSKSRAASRSYLTRILGRPVGIAHVYKHYLTYARVMLDRFFFLTDRTTEFDITISGREVVDELLASGRGFIFLGAHQGSFDVLRVLGASHPELKLKAMMYPENSKRITSLIAEINPSLSQEIILLGRPDAMLQAKQHLDQGGAIGLLGDRIISGDKLLRAAFLGQPANFPAGPLMLASALKVPVVLFYGLYLGGARYEVHFELLVDQVAAKTRKRQSDQQALIDKFAARLGDFCHREPYNWFNFYDFWDSSDAAP